MDMEVVHIPTHTHGHTHVHAHTITQSLLFCSVEKINFKKCLSNLNVFVTYSEWEERGKGRGRGKHIQAPSSAAQTTALGSNGRVQKQHSWPSHTTVDEQGGGKTRLVL